MEVSVRITHDNVREKGADDVEWDREETYFKKLKDALKQAEDGMKIVRISIKLKEPTDKPSKINELPIHVDSFHYTPIFWRSHEGLNKTTTQKNQNNIQKERNDRIIRTMCEKISRMEDSTEEEETLEELMEHDETYLKNLRDFIQLHKAYGEYDSKIHGRNETEKLIIQYDDGTPKTKTWTIRKSTLSIIISNEIRRLDETI